MHAAASHATLLNQTAQQPVMHAQENYGYRINWTRLIAMGLVAIIALTVIGKALGGSPKDAATPKKANTATLSRVDNATVFPEDSTLAEPPKSIAIPRVARGGGGTAKKSPTPKRTNSVKRTTRRSAAAGTGLKAVRSGTARAAAARGVNTRPATVSGVRAKPKLPYTGAPLWLAAILGLFFVSIGVASQRQAETIGDIPNHYRRGPLLRPFWLLQRSIVRMLDHVAP
jgi:hypothetical protein